MKHPSGHHFGFVLEDTVRGHSIKVKDETAIPETQGDDSYFMRVRISPKYGKVVVIFTEQEGPDLFVLNYGGVRFTQILAHGGNNEEHTSGCILVNHNRDIDKMKAWGKMQQEYVEEVEKLQKEGYDVRLQVTNLPQAA